MIMEIQTKQNCHNWPTFGT